MKHRPAFALSVLLLFFAACGGEDAVPPSPTPPAVAASAVPEATTTPRAFTSPASPPAPSPTLPPPPSLTPPPTPPVETPAPRPSPTPAATPRSDGFQYHFGPGVDAFDRALIVRAVEVTSDLLSSGAAVRPASAIFADTSPERLERAFAEGALAQTWRAEGMADRMTRAVAEASFRGIVIHTGHADWQALDATERLRAVAHEYVHVVQLERAGLAVADQTLSGPVNQAPAAGPFWLIEGSAEAVSWLVLQELNLGSYPESLFDYAASAREEATTLAEMESFIGYRAAGTAGLGLAVLSADYLLRNRSLDAIFDFWGNTRADVSWSASFNRHFGLPPAFYYLAFETYYASIWEGFRP